MDTKIDIKKYTADNKYTPKKQLIIDTCGLYIVNGIAHYEGKINRNDWHIQAIQMRCGAGGYTNTDIYLAIIKNGYTKSKGGLTNFLSKFAKECGFTLPDYERVGQVRFQVGLHVHTSVDKKDDFYAQPGDIYDTPEFNDNGFSQRIMTGKIVGDGTETDLMFKDDGVRSVDDAKRAGKFTGGERKLLALLGR